MTVGGPADCLSAIIPIANQCQRPDGHGFFRVIKGVCLNGQNLIDALLGQGQAQNGPQSQFGRTSLAPVRSLFSIAFQCPAAELRQNLNARSERHQWKHRRNTQ